MADGGDNPPATSRTRTTLPTPQGSDSTPEHATGEDHATHDDKHHEGVVPGSQLPQQSKGTPDAEPVPETTEPTPASPRDGEWRARDPPGTQVPP
ncbi:hypothetical protein MTO96_028541 [Rhipicephalus appendiculatus]